MGKAMGLLKQVGSFVVDGIKGFASMAKEAAAGALKTVVEAVQKIGQKLVQWGEELAGKLGTGVAREGEEALEKGVLDTAKVAETDVAKVAEKATAEGAEKATAEGAEKATAEGAEKTAAEDAEKQAAADAEKKS